MQSDKEKFKKAFIKRLIQFSVRTLKLGQKIEKDELLYLIIKQLVRSASSIGANVVEARALSSKRDYIKYFEIALKSANETIYWLIILKETAPKGLEKEIDELYKEAAELANVLGASILTLKNKR